MENDITNPNPTASDLQSEMGKIDWTEEENNGYCLIQLYFPDTTKILGLMTYRTLNSLPNRQGTALQIGKKISQELTETNLRAELSKNPIFLTRVPDDSEMCTINSLISSMLECMPIKLIYHSLMYKYLVGLKYPSRKRRFSITRITDKGKNSVWQITENQEEQN